MTALMAVLWKKMTLNYTKEGKCAENSVSSIILPPRLSVVLAAEHFQFQKSAFLKMDAMLIHSRVTICTSCSV